MRLLAQKEANETAPQAKLALTKDAKDDRLLLTEPPRRHLHRDRRDVVEDIPRRLHNQHEGPRHLDMGQLILQEVYAVDKAPPVLCKPHASK